MALAAEASLANPNENPHFSPPNTLKSAPAQTLLLFLALTLGTTLPLHAQGCTQCLDSTRATPPQVQSAYRHAIYLLGGTAVTLFLAGTLLLRKGR